MLVATLTAAGPDDAGLGGHVITTHVVLTRLLDARTAGRAARLPRGGVGASPQPRSAAARRPSGSGDPGEGAKHWDADGSLDPHHEDLAVAAIRAHARNHDPDAVRATMRRLRRALDEIDEQPDEKTRALVADLLAKLGTHQRG
jgi:hypothetical protein